MDREDRQGKRPDQGDIIIAAGNFLVTTLQGIELDSKKGKLAKEEAGKLLELLRSGAVTINFDPNSPSLISAGYLTDEAHMTVLPHVTLQSDAAWALGDYSDEDAQLKQRLRDSIARSLTSNVGFILEYFEKRGRAYERDGWRIISATEAAQQEPLGFLDYAPIDTEHLQLLDALGKLKQKDVEQADKLRLLIDEDRLRVRVIDDSNPVAFPIFGINGQGPIEQESSAIFAAAPINTGPDYGDYRDMQGCAMVLFRKSLIPTPQETGERVDLFGRDIRLIGDVIEELFKERELVPFPRNEEGRFDPKYEEYIMTKGMRMGLPV